MRGGSAKTTHPQQQKQHQQQQQQKFPVGSLVEVRTDELDFIGVYFTATVLVAPTKKGSSKKKKKRSSNPKNKIYVEYHDLLVEENGSDRLREYVDLSFVRPAPPFREVVTGFEVGDDVDAFYKDGWWAGVVKRVVEEASERRYVVCFEIPPDEREFGLADLRVHWDWVGGSWLRPHNNNQSTAGLMFAVESKAEVSFDREDHQDVWFPATIKKDLGDGAFLIEYCCLDAEEKPQVVKVSADSLHVRPIPPILKDKSYVLLEKVDAFFEFGWWSGVITKELENSRYTVFFKQMKKQLEFDQNELRPHFDWKDGRWSTSFQLSEDVSIPSSDDGIQEHHTPEGSRACAVAVALNNLSNGKSPCEGEVPSSFNSTEDQFEQSTPANHLTAHVTTSLTKRRQDASDSPLALSQSLKKRKEGNALGASQQDTCDSPAKEMLLGAEQQNTCSTTRTNGDIFSDKSSRGKRTGRKPRKGRATRFVPEMKNCTSSSSKTTLALQLESSKLGDAGKEPDAIGHATENVENELANKEDKLHVIIGLPCSEIGSSELGGSRGKRGRPSKRKEIMNHVVDQMQQLDDFSIQELKDGKQLETGELSEKKKGRVGRLRKVLNVNIQTPVTGNAQDGAAGSLDSSRKGGDPHKPEMAGPADSLPNHEEMALMNDILTNDNSHCEIGKSKPPKRRLDKIPSEKIVKYPVILPENRSLTRRRKKIIDETIASEVQGHDASQGTIIAVHSTMAMEKPVSEAPSLELDNEPLSKWVHGLQQSPSAIDGSRLSPVSIVENGELRRDLSLPEESGEKQSENVRTSSLVDEGSIVPIEPQNLPFIKNTVLWSYIESLEVFSRMPQRPHFKPLEILKESLREGLAIGYMVTFSSVVEKVYKLQLNDAESIIDDIVGTLSDLEKHGFDVTIPRDHVTEVLAAKEKQGKLVDEMNELENKILEHNQVKVGIEEEMEGIHKQVRGLQEKLSFAESAKRKEEDEIALLLARLKETEKGIENVGREIEAFR